MTDVFDFWEKQAEQHGTSGLATAPDHYYREFEIARIVHAIKVVEQNASILDVGCGNGYSTIKVAKQFPHSMVIGVDFSPKMIEAAKEAAKIAGITNVSFFVGDVLSISRHPELQHQKFDVVFTERCLINLANWDEQKLAILQLRKLLTGSGHLILVENTKNGLANLNTLRTSIGLEPIQERWHNNYLPDEGLDTFLTKMAPNILVPLQVENIGNMYYILSRVVNAKLAQLAGKDPSYDDPINKIAAELPSFGNEYACSPNFMFIFQNIDTEARKADAWDSKKTLS